MKVIYRALLVVALLLASFVYIAPTMMQPLPTWWPSFFPKEPIRLGLDLQGGIHLILQVEVDKAVENAVNGTMEDLKRELATAQIPIAKLERQGDTIHIQPQTPDKGSAISDLVKNKFPTLVYASEANADAGEADGAGRTVNQRDAVEQKAGRESTEQKILERGFAGTCVAAHEADQRIN